MKIAELFARYARALEDANALQARQDAAGPGAAMALEEATIAAFETAFELERKIVETRAECISSVRLKLMVSLENARQNAPGGELESDWQMVASAAADLIALSAPPPAPVPALR